MLESILIWNFAPFQLSSSLMFLSSALARPVFLTWQKTQWGETGTQETFCCWYLAFSYRFCWITLISSAKGAQLWSRPVEKQSPPGLLWGSSPIVPAIGIGIGIRRWNMLLMLGASHSDSQWEGKQWTVSPPEAGRRFMSSHVFFVWLRNGISLYFDTTVEITR